MTPQSNLGCFHGGLSSKNQEKNKPRAKLPHTPQQDRKQITLSQQKLVYQEKNMWVSNVIVSPLKNATLICGYIPNTTSPPGGTARVAKGKV